ncbi:MAG TPA: phosphatidate cytidylyltransferase [Candidatus Dormibacteraeota bacterium]|nr:phosphatidate cytidylyltransferase [Candidatus Dormibacteraeota bacterium]
MSFLICSPKIVLTTKIWTSKRAKFCLHLRQVGFAGGLTMSAIKRDRGVKDLGGTIEGHGGILDRMDSICFSAPLFFHLTRWIFVSDHSSLFR